MKCPHYIRFLMIITMLGGCGRDEPPSIPDRSSFDEAVKAYLQAKTMDLAIFEYRAFNLADDGRNATAVIAMIYGGEGYSKARVQFRFIFEKLDGTWQVASHQKHNSINRLTRSTT